jgi:hypothetical protein
MRVIDPNAPTVYGRSRADLEEMVLWCTLLPTHDAHRMAKQLERFLMNARFVYGDETTPFELVRIMVGNGSLKATMVRYAFGQYERLVRCWTELTRLYPHTRRRINPGGSELPHLDTIDLLNLTELEKIHGIGPKTARMIVLHNVRGARCIPVDIHWMKELKEKGYPITATSLDARTHASYEAFALLEVDKSGKTAAAYDFLIWKKWNAAYLARRKAA